MGYEIQAGTKLQGIWDDLPPVPLLTGKPANSEPLLTVFKGGVQQYTFGVGNEVFGASEITHQYDEGTDVQIHLHWSNQGTEGTDKYAKWEFEYSIGNPLEAFGNASIVTVEVKISANTADRTHLITQLGMITGTSLKIGSYICWRLKRIASSGTAVASDPFALAIGFHVEIDTFGSRQMTIK